MVPNLVFRITGICIAFVGIVYFALPVFVGYFQIESFFGQALCLYLGFLSLCYGQFKKKGLKILMNVLLGIFVIGMIWTIFLSVKIIGSAQEKEIPKDATVIILGCQIKVDGPSHSLQQRLDVAIEYLEKKPQSKCIVTGGQGYNEPMSEAVGMKKYLLENGISENRIYTEDKSTSTWENFLFSINIIEKENLSKNVAVATQDFHMNRACEQAIELKLNPFPITAKTHPLLYPCDFGRELLATTKYYVLRLFR